MPSASARARSSSGASPGARPDPPRARPLASREWARARLRRHVLPGASAGAGAGHGARRPQRPRRGHRRGFSPRRDLPRAGPFRGAGRARCRAPHRRGAASGPLAVAPRGPRLLQPSPPTAVLVGGDVPVMRAAIMGIVLVLGRGLDLDADLANLLGAAALVLLAEHPGSVLDVGFLLSFGATLAIILVAPGPRAAASGPAPGHGRARRGLGRGASGAAAPARPGVPPAHAGGPRPEPGRGASLRGGAAARRCGLPAERPERLDGGSSRRPRLDGGRYPPADLRRRRPRGGRGLARSGSVPLGAVPRGLWASGLSPAVAGHEACVLHGVVTLGLALGPGARADGRLELAVLDVGQGDALVLRSPSGRTMVVDAGLAREATSTWASAWWRLISGPSACGASIAWWSPTRIPITPAASPFVASRVRARRGLGGRRAPGATSATTRFQAQSREERRHAAGGSARAFVRSGTGSRSRCSGPHRRDLLRREPATTIPS